MSVRINQFEQIQPLSQVRANLYRLFSALFSAAPTGDVLSEILSESSLETMEEVLGKQTLKYWREFSRSFDGETKGLEGEFDSLFLVPAVRYVAPYESAYREKRLLNGKEIPGLLMGRTTEKVMMCYEDFNAMPVGVDIPDHVAVELGFMHYLLGKELAAWLDKSSAHAVAVIEKEVQFLTEHLASWVPELCSIILERTHTDFYRGLARLTEQFLTVELSILPDLYSSHCADFNNSTDHR